MVARLHAITIDAENSYKQALWWGEALGWVEDKDDPNGPDHTENYVGPAEAEGTGLLFINVPEKKTIKNRIHLDLESDRTREEEVRRLVELGASVVADNFVRPDGSGWVVLADPEGNEFCIVRSEAERAATATE
ncbi:VOC family protein [Natronoglycomyces albus]|uniref:VOC family protein n=1 Tax=Natronoglycomyces albus TaxID=2811108 RepID=A0A895XMQ4_9ACTN|nr:VOC family protein [Natronoglycomyces albus]QSB04679.1 VOC family protein [Natronoglycomyces albus]